MKLIELHVLTTGLPFSIRPADIIQIGLYKNGDSYILRSDGGEVDVRETYDELKGLLNGQ
jgi:hypothetical protein